ncbi:MAG: hypothetical protein E7376_04790 [Clostridiales bacterium]|nr:hypothetical protein [Clostridiales bacterium]
MKQTLKYIYGVVFENLKFAESKHTLILTISSAVLAFATTFFGDNIAQNLFAIASIIFALIAIFYSFVALVARHVKVKQKKIKKIVNLIYYKDIMHYDEIGYIDAIKKNYNFTNIYKPDNMDYDLAKQIISVSKLTWIKSIYFNFAVVFLVVSIVCIILTVLIRGNIW